MTPKSSIIYMLHLNYIIHVSLVGHYDIKTILLTHSEAFKMKCLYHFQRFCKKLDYCSYFILNLVV